MTKLVHVNKDVYDVYIGRAYKGEIPDPPQYGCFGNPYTLAKYGRKESIILFAKYFYDRIENDEEFKKAVLELRNKILGCWCKPLACHGDIIVDYLDNYFGDGIF